MSLQFHRGKTWSTNAEVAWCHCKMGTVLVQVDLLAVVLCQLCWPKLLQRCSNTAPCAILHHQMESVWIQLHPAQAPSWTPEHGGLMQSLLELSPEGANSQLDPNQPCNLIRTSSAWALQPLLALCQGPGAVILTQLSIEAAGSSRTSVRALCHIKAAQGFADLSCFWKQWRCTIS